MNELEFQELLEKVEENQKKIDETLRVVRENQKKIKGIHAYMRRTFIAKIFYWILIFAVTAGVFYTARPYVQRTVEAYRKLEDKIETGSGYIEEPSKLFRDVGLLNKVFEFFSKKDTMPQRDS